jgi:hypothetical protein
MSSRKQRRRREKQQRHEWEYVEIDAEGNESPAEIAKPKTAEARSNGKPVKTQTKSTQSARPRREVKPPSWNRAIKRGLLFVPFLFIFLYTFQHVNPATAVGISVLYSAVFVPMFFFVDRMAYRAYQRKLGQG